MHIDQISCSEMVAPLNTAGKKNQALKTTGWMAIAEMLARARESISPNIKYTDRVRLHPNLARLPPMPYRHRESMSRKLRAMRDARERRRLEGGESRYSRELPALRRTLIIIDYDFGRVEHRIDLYRTPRIDCYRAVADGVEWKRRVGWSKVLAGLRVKFPRVRAP